MVKPILEIRNIGKKYQIQHLAGGYLSLRERLANALKFERVPREDFWALQNVSFDVQAGESFGIIGRNGAGKSTLLKILSKITPPTKGRIVSRGRIASLLEVGTGFHPELTGRENIFFNGSLLGMTTREIEAKFDEIVDFSGVERFLDTSLKHYSSGMQLRLAFSVAAFLDPEIMVIDEVLAVGDAEFQKKCLRKMEDVSRSGRTILFVSHNMEAVRSLCSHGVILKDGQVAFVGTADRAVSEYLSVLSSEQQRALTLEEPIAGKDFSLHRCWIATQDGSAAELDNGKELEVSFEISNSGGFGFSVYMFLYREESLAFIASDLHQPTSQIVKTSARFLVTFVIPPYLLNPGHCRIGLMIADSNGNTEQFFNHMDLLQFQIKDDGVRRDNRYTLGWSGAVSPLLHIRCKTL
ncbi:MAG: ABC transporter ATP-binding protein [Cyclobacteriaceae bacterium]|nr:ABC transporter ATP-binding protein [Cyclobacteriaceae bacterium]